MNSGHDTPKKSSVTQSDLGDAPQAGAESRKRPAANASTRAGKRPSVQGKDNNMGSALRSVYQRAVEEAIPDEMIDLLGKLD